MTPEYIKRLKELARVLEQKTESEDMSDAFRSKVYHLLGYIDALPDNTNDHDTATNKTT